MSAPTVALHGFTFQLDEHDSLGLSSGTPFEPETLHVMQLLAKPGFTVLDIGANIGFFTAHLAQLVGDTGQVIAVEPNQQNFQLLQANVRANQLHNVVLHNVAVGETAGNAALYLSDWNGGMHRLYESVCCTETTETVPVVTIDSLTAGQTIDLLKIDIEGYEFFALKGARACLVNNPGIKIIAEYCPATLMEAGAAPTAFLAYLAELGFHPTTLDGQALAWQQLQQDAALYEAYGADRFVQECTGKSNPEILELVMAISAQLGCQRPLLENLIFAR